jgi:purine-binding chemotaxis protein CheW
MEAAMPNPDLGGQVVIFRLGDGRYAVEIAAVREIIRPQPITVVPLAPPFVVGVLNLRGSIVPVLDLRRRCGLAAAPQTRDSRVVVVQVEGVTVGLQVDSVSEVVSLSPDCIEPAPSLIDGGREQLLLGVARLDQHLVMLLDLGAAVTTVGQATSADAKAAVA